MKEAVILMRFLRHDPVGQRFGLGVLVLAWLAVAWTSLTFVVAGAAHGLAFNLADLFAVGGDSVLLSVVILLGLQRRAALHEPV